uniref:Cytochrome P450-dependent monooxygenase n=3 Tax=Selaginella moellendorffii TaxID=88036 RepID=B2XCI9_SELML|nr:cytochrome P450-dependent monooxygenase [Selaginella moellendorffii]
MDAMNLFAAAAFLVIGLVYWLANRQRPSTPPGPWKLPVVGNLHQLLGKQPHRVITELSKKYGHLMSLRLGSVQAVVASSSQTAKIFLQTHDAIFSSRPEVANAKLLTYGFSDIMWAPYSQQWRELRKLSVLELFTAKRLESFQGIRRDETLNMIHRLLKLAREKKVVNFRDAATELSWSIIRTMVSNRQEFVNLEEGLKVKSSLDRALQLAGAFNLADYIPFFRAFDVQGFRQQSQILHEQLDFFFQGLVDSHRRQERPPNASEDFIDVLLSIQKQNGVEYVSDDTIKATIQDIFAAGTDTSSMTLEWALTELVRHPRSLQKAQDEISFIVGNDRMVSEADIPKLQFLQAVVKETLRLHPPGPLLQHQSVEDCKVGPYSFPAGTRVIINVYGISRDPSLWEQPLEFDPWRFLDKPTASIDMKGQHFEFIPFGSGRRICPGLAMGVRTVELALAQSLHCFHWHSPDDRVPDIEEVCGMTLPKKNPLLLAPSPRLADAVYGEIQRM